MTNRVIGPGIGLPAPQILYPPNLAPAGIPFSQGSSDVALAAGESIQIPAGEFFIDLGKYSVLEYQDPVRSGPNITQNVGVWRVIRAQRGSFTLRSDGINFRVSNLTGCAVAAIVTNTGNGYVQASTTVTPSTGTSTWQAIVGGALVNITCSVVSSAVAVGANYSKAPIVYIPAPPAPGVQATAIAAISAGAISGFTIVNAGAGYTTAPTITILPDPYDAASGIVNAVAAASLGSSGVINAVLCTNPGAPVATSMTLTVAGAGTSALVSPVYLTTISSLSLTAAGSGTATGANITTTGGIPPQTSAVTAFDGFIPRQAQVFLSVNGGAAVGYSLIDGGLFLGTVFPIVGLYGGVVVGGVAPTVALVQGSATDQVIIQPL